MHRVTFVIRTARRWRVANVYGEGRPLGASMIAIRFVYVKIGFVQEWPSI
jgi:hypothetical protein